MLLFLLACFFPLFPMDLPGISISATAQPLATEPRPAALPRLRLSAVAPPRRPGQHLRLSAPASSIFLMALRLSAPASNKPHPAEKSTPVWLAIWRIWAGFANSQHRDAVFATPDNICAHSSLLQPWSCCSDRRKSFGPSAPIAYATSVSPPDEAIAWPVRWYQVLDEAVAWLGTQVLGVR